METLKGSRNGSKRILNLIEIYGVAKDRLAPKCSNAYISIVKTLIIPVITSGEFSFSSQLVITCKRFASLSILEVNPLSVVFYGRAAEKD